MIPNNAGRAIYSLVFVLVIGIINGQEHLPETQFKDYFQDCFFEALKHSTLQNYDRAIQSLKTCDSIRPNDPTVAFQLGKNYSMSQQWALAQPQYLKALTLNPENKWFLEGYYTASVKMSQIQEAQEVLEKMTKNDRRFTNTLALWLAHKGNFDEAYKTAHVLKNSRLIKDITLIKQAIQKHEPSEALPEATSEVLSLKTLDITLKQLIAQKDYPALEKTAKEALEVYPAQATFYYAYGLALNRLGKVQEGVEQLLSALEFLVEDPTLEHNTYTALSEGYKLLGNTEKQNFYLNKLQDN